jgi:hypothetical protein
MQRRLRQNVVVRGFAFFALILATAADVLVQTPPALAALGGTWTLDARTDPRTNRPATELVVMTSATQVTIRRHWTSDTGVGEGTSSTDMFTLDGRESRAADGRMGAATLEAGVLTLTMTRTRISTSPLQPAGEYRTVTREVYRPAGDRLSVERTVFGIRPGEAPGRGPVALLTYTRAAR